MWCWRDKWKPRNMQAQQDIWISAKFDIRDRSNVPDLKYLLQRYEIVFNFALPDEKSINSVILSIIYLIYYILFKEFLWPCKTFCFACFFLLYT